MKIMRKLLILSVMMLACVVGQANGARSFYVNSFSNSKEANGSMNSPFKSLDELKNVKFQPGDCVYLAGNQIFNGSIKIADLKATPERPLTITSYGAGVAHIYSGDASAIQIEYCEYVRVKM